MHKNPSKWAQINVANLKNNIKKTKALLSNDTKLMCVVKADAYGHGCQGLISAMLEAGADMFAVAFTGEAIGLREQGLDRDILVLGYTPHEELEDILKYDLIQTVSDISTAQALSSLAKTHETSIRIHIKLNTGMNRYGFSCDRLSMERVKEICSLPGLVAEGVFTHFAKADLEDDNKTESEFKNFMDFIEGLSEKGVNFKYRHACNSAALLRYKHMHLDMVRPGIILYGINPSPYFRIADLGFKPVMSFHSQVAAVREVRETCEISYGGTYIAEKKAKIAIIPTGYADGYLRGLSNKAEVIIGEDVFPVAGRICMDSFMVDITSARKPVKVGDEVILFGSRAANENSIEKIAGILDTIPYEVACLIGKRVPRLFIE